jgi:hypothetical protein
MNALKKGKHRIFAEGDNPCRSTKTDYISAHETKDTFSQDLTKLNAFIEVPLLYFFDTEFNNCYYRLTKYFNLNNPKKQTI